MSTAKPPTDDSGKRTVFLCKSVGASACGVALAIATGANAVYARTVADGTVYAMQHPGTRHATIDKAIARVEGVAFVEGLSDIGSRKVVSYGAGVEAKRGCALYGLIYNVDKRCGNGFATHEEVAQFTKDGVVKQQTEVVTKKREREEAASADGEAKARKAEAKWLLSKGRMYTRGTMTRWFCSTCCMHGSLKKLAKCGCRRLVLRIGCHCGFEADLKTDMALIKAHAHEECSFIKETTFEVERNPDHRIINAVVQRAKGGWWTRVRDIMAKREVSMDMRLLYAAQAWTYAVPPPPWPFRHLGPPPGRWQERAMERLPANLGSLWQMLAELGTKE